MENAGLAMLKNLKKTRMTFKTWSAVPCRNRIDWRKWLTWRQRVLLCRWTSDSTCGSGRDWRQIQDVPEDAWITRDSHCSTESWWLKADTRRSRRRVNHSRLTLQYWVLVTEGRYKTFQKTRESLETHTVVLNLGDWRQIQDVPQSTWTTHVWHCCSGVSWVRWSRRIYIPSLRHD